MPDTKYVTCNACAEDMEETPGVMDKHPKKCRIMPGDASPVKRARSRLRAIWSCPGCNFRGFYKHALSQHLAENQSHLQHTLVEDRLNFPTKTYLGARGVFQRELYFGEGLKEFWNRDSAHYMRTNDPKVVGPDTGRPCCHLDVPRQRPRTPSSDRRPSSATSAHGPPPNRSRSLRRRPPPAKSSTFAAAGPSKTQAQARSTPALPSPKEATAAGKGAETAAAGDTGPRREKPATRPSAKKATAAGKETETAAAGDAGPRREKPATRPSAKKTTAAGKETETAAAGDAGPRREKPATAAGEEAGTAAAGAAMLRGRRGKGKGTAFGPHGPPPHYEPARGRWLIEVKQDFKEGAAWLSSISPAESRVIKNVAFEAVADINRLVDFLFDARF